MLHVHPLQQGNERVLVTQVRQQFKANIQEVDDDKVGVLRSQQQWQPHCMSSSSCSVAEDS
jgi:hypothetical protein